MHQGLSPSTHTENTCKGISISPPLYVINGNNWFHSLCHLLISPACAALLKPAHMHIVLSLPFLFSINHSKVIFLFFFFCCLLPSFMKSKWDLILNVVVCTVCVVSAVGKCVAAIIWQKHKAAPLKPLSLETPHAMSRFLLMKVTCRSQDPKPSYDPNSV